MNVAYEDALYLDTLADGVHLEIETAHHLYSVVKAGEDGSGGIRVWISGHPNYCPQPVEVWMDGSIGPGMRLEFRHPFHDLVTTSKILGIRQLT